MCFLMPKRLAWVAGGGFLLAALGCVLEAVMPEAATSTCGHWHMQLCKLWGPGQGCFWLLPGRAHQGFCF